LKNMEVPMINRILKLSITAFLAILIFLMAAAPALAFDARGDTDVIVASGEVVDGDIYIAATNVIIDGTVNGDVFAVGQTIRINGTINGGVTAAGQTISLNGKVSSGVRLAGQTVTVGGKIVRDLMVAASDVTITNSAEIGKDLNSYSSSTVINGLVSGNVTGSINNLTISDRINGNVKVITNTLLVNSTANIRGNLDYTSNNIAKIQSGAVIAGTTLRIVPPKDEPSKKASGGAAGGFIFRIFAFLSTFIVGLVIIFIARKYVVSLALAIRDRPVSSLGWGALLFFVTPLAAFVVMLTVIGIPIALVSLITWGILLYLSQIPVGLLIGWLILSRKRDNFSHGLLLGFLALGLAILYLITAIPVLGWIIWILVMIFGLGSLIAVLRSRQKINPVTPGP
jgi:cytoskeletal protein CcmA (bactofilin family)